MVTRRLIAVALAQLLIAALFCAANDSKEEQAKQLFAAANAATDLQQQPYQLRAHMRLRFRTDVEGELVVDWNPPEQRRIEIRLPGYTEIHVLNGGQEWVMRPATATPLEVKQALAIVNPTMLRLTPSAKVEHIENLARGGQELTCVTEERRPTPGKLGPFTYEVCFDGRRHLAMSKVARTPDLVHVTEYGDYQQVGEKYLPRFMRVSKNGTVVAEVTVQELIAAPADAQAFAPLPTVQPRHSCAEPRRAEPTQAPDPEYTTEARSRRIQGIVVLGITVGADGKVAEASVIRPLDPGLDQRATKAVKNWRFKPAMCASTPVASEINVEVNFRLH